ncbi:hypothetical protein HY095_01560 [Candidatus Micrarchaeota archaeon]|nr:hypothetical protein [Candidatus Micrarchaeota archaeon]
MEFDLAIIDDALLVAGLLLVLLGQLWGIIPALLGLAMMYARGEISLSPKKKPGDQDEDEDEEPEDGGDGDEEGQDSNGDGDADGGGGE